MILIKGDRVEHMYHGKGTFIKYTDFDGDVLVNFDEQGKELTVSESLLSNLEADTNSNY
jgi:hypothetical protein